MTPKAEKPLQCSPRQTAELLAVSERTAWRMIARGELPSRKLGRKRFVPREAIEKFVAGAA